MDEAPMTFWEHLDVLRASIIRMLVAVAVATVGAFCLKEPLFRMVLAPADASFPTYRWLGIAPFKIRLVNIGLTEQFMIHLKTALAVGILVASPYVILLLYRFIAPGLYRRERSVTARVVVSGGVMFFVGVAVNYLLIFPLTVRFLGTYSVSASVGNLLSLESYIDTLLMMSLVFGVVFEIPVISWLLAKAGLLKAEWMARYRRHAVVAILILAAIVTPTSDAFTLIIVSLPIWLLYEVSILIVRRSQ